MYFLSQSAIIIQLYSQVIHYLFSVSLLYSTLVCCVSLNVHATAFHCSNFSLFTYVCAGVPPDNMLMSRGLQHCVLLLFL